VTVRKRLERRDPDLVSLADAADWLGISEDTARKLAAEGTFPGDAAFQVSSRWRVSMPRLRRALHGTNTEAAS